MTILNCKQKRLNIIDLKNNYPEKFGRFVMALKNLEESDDWYRICGIHGNTFKPNDPGVLCPTDPNIVAVISDTGEPVYCKHSVYPFIAWHTPYIYQFELLLNKYNNSDNKDYIALPYIDLTNFSNDFTFMNTPTISIFYNKKKITIDNPLASAYYYVDGVKTKISRNGYLSPKNHREKIQLNTVRKQLNNVLYASTYEKFSSHPVSTSSLNIVVNYTPLETPHNSLHDIIGGNGGNMSDITISAFDPIFWLHHCNMDRHFYTWMYNNTNQFTKSVYPEKMQESSYESTQAPFFKNYIYSTNFNNYNYGWQNSKLTEVSPNVMLLKDMLNIEKFPFTYDIIKPTKKLSITSFVELIDIPIPRESVTIVVYLYLKTQTLNKDLNFAGSSSWFGINRKEKFCQRCQVTRTNIKIDIEEYVNENKITKDNINDYILVIEGEGRLIKVGNNYNIYDQEDLIKDGSFLLVIE